MPSLADNQNDYFAGDRALLGVTVNAQNTAPTGAAPTGSVIALNANGKTTASFQVNANTLSQPLSLYATVDGTTWFPVGGSPLLNQSNGRWQDTIPAGVTGIFTAAVGDFLGVRLSTPNAAVTGSATVGGQAGAEPSILAVEPPKYSNSRVLADGQAKAGAGVLHAVTVSALSATPTGGLLSIYDSLTETGTVLYAEWVPAGVLPHTILLDIAFGTGLFIGFDATLAGVQVNASFI